MEEMKKAKLMLQALPALHKSLFVGVGPVGDGNLHLETTPLEKAQESADVPSGTSRSQEKGGSEVIDWIRRHQDRLAAVVDLVYAKNAGEVFEHPSPIGGAVYLGVRPLEAVVDEADRDLQEEVLLEVALDFVDRKVVADEEIDDFLTDGVGVAAPEGDSFNGRGEEFGARAGGGVDPDHKAPQHGLLVGEVLDLASSDALAPTLLTTARTGMPDRSPSFRLNNRGENPRQTIFTHISPSLVA
jgi:hypothetical protein